MDELDALLGGDPLGYDPLAGLGLGLPRKSRAKTKPLPEKEQKSVIREALNTGIGGLQYLGETLDKPGRAVRGLLAGRPGELANLIPFSDTFGLTDPSQSVSGRDLLEKAGLAGPNQVGSLDMGDVAGFGAEVLLDPTTYLTFGASAVGKAGKVAKAAGITAKGAARYKTLGQHLAGASDDVLRAASEAAAKSGTTLDALSNQKLGGLFGVKVPFMEGFVPEFAQSAGAQAVGEGLGKAARLPLTLAAKNKTLAKAGSAIGDYWRGAFDPSVQNQFDPVAQTLAKEGSEHINRGQAKVLEGFLKDSDELDSLIKDFSAKHGNDPFFAPGKVSPAEIVRRAVQHSAETKGAPGAYDLVSGGMLKLTPPQAAVAPDLLDTMRKMDPFADNGALISARELRKQFPNMPKDQFDALALQAAQEGKLSLHAHDYVSSLTDAERANLIDGKFVGANIRQGQKAAKAVPPAPVLSEIEQRTAKLGQGIVDAENQAFAQYQALGGNVQALNDTEEFSHLFRQPLEKATRPSGLKMRTKAMKYLPAEQVNSMIRDPSLLMEGAQKAKPDVVARRLLEGEYGKLMTAAAMAAETTPQAAAKDMAEWLSSKGTSYIREGKNFFGNDVLKNKLDYLTSLNRKTANMQAVHSVIGKNLTNELEGTVSVAEALAGAGLDPTAAIEHMSRTLKMAPDAVRTMRVPEEIAGAAASVLHKQQSPEWMKKIGEKIDGVINTYKRNLTVPFPSFHVRNLLSGQWMNMASNLVETPADLVRYGKSAKEAIDILKKPAGSGAISEMIAHNVLPLDFGTRDVDILEAAAGSLPKKGTQFLNPALGVPRMGMDLAQGVKSEFHAARAAGSGRVSSVIQGAYKGVHGTGTEAARQVEYMNRASMYLYLKAKGWAPEAAAAEVRKLQIDYCVDESTEALTKRGWLTVDEIQIGDETLSIDPETREIVWSPVTAVNVFQSKGTGIRIKSSRMDALVTGNHRWLCEGKKGRGGHWTLHKKGVTSFRTTSEIEESDLRLILAGGSVAHAPDSVVYDDRLVELVGWYVTEGWTANNKCAVFVSQSQSHNPKHVESIRGIADSYRAEGATVTEMESDNGWGTISTWYFGKGVGEQVRAAAPDKQITMEFLLKLTESQLLMLFRTLMDGDGTVNSKGTEVWSQKDRGRLDAFAAICGMIGKRTNERRAWGDTECRCVSVYSTKNVYSYSLKFTPEEYHGRFWCPTTGTGTWFARRNGVTYWTGNSDLTAFEKNVMKRIVPFYAFTRKNVPVLLQKMIEHPGGVAGKTVRASNIGRSEDDFVPPYVGEGMSVPLPGGDGRYLSELGLPTDQFANLFAKGPTLSGTIKRTGQKLLSQIAPPLKAAIEMPTGINLFSGKPFNEMYQYPFDDPLANAALGETPASRYISAGRTLGDPRKGLGTKAMNLLTGLRITDVSGGIEKQKEYAAKKILDEMLREEKGIGSFSEVYKKEGAELTPEAEKRYRAYRGLVSQQRKDAKEKKAKK